MYLLGTVEVGHLAGRLQTQPIFDWISVNKPGRNLFVSVVSLGVLADTIAAYEPPERDNWRRLLAAARRTFQSANALVTVDLDVIDAWVPLRGMDLFHNDGAPVGEDERIILATAIARSYTLVTRREGFHDQVVDRTTLTIVEP